MRLQNGVFERTFAAFFRLDPRERISASDAHAILTGAPLPAGSILSIYKSQIGALLGGRA